MFDGDAGDFNESTDDGVIPTSLQTQETPHNLAVGTGAPSLSWRLEGRRSGIRQRGYELQSGNDPSFNRAISSGFKPALTPYEAPWPFAPLNSRDVRWIRVRVWTDVGRTTWSTPLRLEAALLRQDDWVARPISPTSNVGSAGAVAVPLLRRAFDLPCAVKNARLYVSALGIHATTINGTDVSADLLEPGWSAYSQRLLYATHDVTDLLREGENVLASSVGDGWWRGELTWLSRRAVYGDTTALLAQLEIELTDGQRLTIPTDDTWCGATGGWLSADLYHGSAFDFRAEPLGWRCPSFDDGEWEPVAVLALPRHLETRPMNGVKVLDTWPLAGAPKASGTTRYDCGQNLTGWLRLTADGPSGATITVRHAEVLDDYGELHTAALRNARATDSYVLDGSGTVLLEPLHTFHGFRFAEVTCEHGAAIKGAEVRIVTSDLFPTGSFTCSDPTVTKLWENIRWSQRGNFLALPTDCPQRDERMGWTGDIQVFASTACMNSDVRSFLASWMKDLAVDQRDDGAVPSVVPNCLPDGPLTFGAAGWGDAAVLVPWALYEAYGDRTILQDQFESMTAWVDWCAARLNENGVWEGDIQFGDWLDPGAPPERPHEATTDRDYVASSYLAYSARILAQAAEVLGSAEHERQYGNLSDQVAAATWARWQEHALTTQTGCALAIEFGIAPADLREMVADRLVSLVQQEDGRIAAGFLGTPLLLPALTRTDRVAAAYRLLLNRGQPGWLYQVDRGATTIWERWDAIRDDGSIHPGDMAQGDSMMSFNHYAYGAVGSWLYRTVAGIAPDLPGYERIRFAPRPGGDLSHAKATLITPFGAASIEWHLLSAKRMIVDLLVPPGAAGIFSLPPTWSLDARDAPHEIFLSSGTHRIDLTPAANAEFN